MKRLAEATYGGHDQFNGVIGSIQFAVDKLDSGKFQLTAVRTTIHCDKTERVVISPPSRFRAKTVEELVPLSLAAFYAETHETIRNVVYDADDANYQDEKSRDDADDADDAYNEGYTNQ